MTTTNDTSRLAAIVLVIVGVLLIGPVLFMGVGMMGTGHMTGDMWTTGPMAGTTAGWMLFAWAALQVLFLAAIVGGLYLTYRAIASDDDDTDPALAELRAAYARGELSDEEYETRRETLERDA